MSENSAVPKFIDGDDCEIKEGEIGFLVERSNPIKHSDRWGLSYRPAYTNQSRMPRLDGWCGSTNDVSVYAHGLARAGEANANTGRVRISTVADATEIEEALETLGYPELAKE
jgi:hypothetical protein